ncbi:MAG: toxic anion resistance protein [Ectothiorhodospiraceae bacterium]|nr:toxic anion resistance protein [Ectothiorhodospiraceae bacterium]
MTDSNSSRSGADPLSPPLTEALNEEIEREAAQGTAAVDLDSQADTFVRQVLAGLSEEQRRAVDHMGIETQRQAARRSSLLETPIRQLADQEREGGGPVARALLDLRGKMRELDPNRNNLRPGALARVMSFIPGVGNHLQRYFRKFETAQQALDAIIGDLEQGQDVLRRDNLTLADDQQGLRESLGELHTQIELGKRIDQRLQQAAGETTDERRRFIEEELLFPLRQRILDLQQQYAVSQQGVLALEVVIRNNRELIRGVDRAINVTVSALNVAVAVALALANQRLVLDRVRALSDSTSELIAGTAQALRQQGTDIHARASDSVLDMERLEQAFSDVLAAIDEVNRYRREALPDMERQIGSLEHMIQRGDAAIRRIEPSGNGS